MDAMISNVIHYAWLVLLSIIIIDAVIFLLGFTLIIIGSIRKTHRENKKRELEEKSTD